MVQASKRNCCFSELRLNVLGSRMMIRQNLLVLGLALIAVTGCASTTSQNCGSPCSVGKHSRHQHHRCRSSRCSCNQGGPLFPGDAWGQPVGAYPMVDQWAMGSEFGGCCDSGMMDSGCSGCGSDMSGMSGMMMPAESSSGCNCGGQQSAGMHSAPMMMSPQPLSQPYMNGPPAPMPPAVFEAPGNAPADQNLPPVPSDAAPTDPAPPAGPMVDPVSWETPVFFPANQAPQRSNVPLRRAQPVPVR